MTAGEESTASTDFDYAKEALDIARNLDDRLTTAWCLYAFGRCLHALNEHQRSYEAFEESYAIFTGEKHEVGCAYSMSKMGSVARDSGDMQTAVDHLAIALGHAKCGGDKWALASTILQLGGVELRRDNYPAAARHLTECMGHYLGIRAPWDARYTVARLITAEIGLGRTKRAAKLAGFKAGLRATTGTDGDTTDRYFVKDNLDDFQGALGWSIFDDCFAEGRARSFERGVRYALSVEDA